MLVEQMCLNIYLMTELGFLSEHQAIFMLNFCNSEKSYMAGALIPPSCVSYYDKDDMFSSMSAHIKTFESEAARPAAQQGHRV